MSQPKIMAKKTNPKVGITIFGCETRVLEATTANTAMTRANESQRKTENMTLVRFPSVFSEISPKEVPLFRTEVIREV